MNFVTIDFETATAQRDSPSEIGLTFVEDSRITETRSWLIKPHYYPHFDYFNIAIHGIHPQDVKNEPEFCDLRGEIQPLIDGRFLIAHNAGFDFSVLRKTLDTYKIPYPTLSYSCSYIFLKRVWQGLPAYDLKTLCRTNNINLQHHRAAADSRAMALAKINPNVYSEAVAGTLNNLALFESGLGHNEKTIEYFDESLKIFRQLAQINPVFFFDIITKTLMNLGDLQHKISNYKEAENTYQEALTIFQRLYNTNPEIYLIKANHYPLQNRQFNTPGLLLTFQI